MWFEAVMTSEPIDLQAYFPFFLGTISNRWTTTSSRIYFERFGVGIGEWRVLASIQALGQASSQQIVGLMSMDAAAVSRAVAKLEQDDFIKRVPGRFVGRTKPYELTEEGRDLYAALREVALAREDQLLGALSAEERRTLIELMRKVMSRIDDL
jgi:DNA-binding MarR family transcriptional regulator